MIFTVSARNGNEIVMEEDDKHLTFGTSVLIDREQSEIYLTTVVKYHNWGGRLYFIPVKPVHRMLVKSQIKRAIWKYLQADGSETIKLTFEAIKAIIGFDIDHSFLTYKKEAKAFGYEVGKISLKEKYVTFNKID
jgi:hypothetical protein